MRPRFKLGAICHADGSSDVYHASRRAHITHLAKAHEEFIASDLSKSFMGIAHSATRPTIHGNYHEVLLFGEWTPIPRGSDIQRYIDGNFKLR